jgi:hypothetical protein
MVQSHSRTSLLRAETPAGSPVPGGTDPMEDPALPPVMPPPDDPTADAPPVSEPPAPQTPEPPPPGAPIEPPSKQPAQKVALTQREPTDRRRRDHAGQTGVLGHSRGSVS